MDEAAGPHGVGQGVEDDPLRNLGAVDVLLHPLQPDRVLLLTDTLVQLAADSSEQ